MPKTNLRAFYEQDRRERLGDSQLKVKEVLKPVVREYSLGEVKAMFNKYFNDLETRFSDLLDKFREVSNRTDLASPEIVDSAVKRNFDEIKQAFKDEITDIRKDIRTAKAPPTKETVYLKPPVVDLSVNTSGLLPLEKIGATGLSSTKYLKGDGTWATVSAGSASTYRVSFVNADLSAGVLTVTHSLGEKIVNVQVFNNSDKLVRADDVTLVDTNSLTVDLSSFGALTGTWNVVVNA